MRNHAKSWSGAQILMMLFVLLGWFLTGCGPSKPCQTNDDCADLGDGYVCVWDGVSKTPDLKRHCAVPFVGQACLAKKDCGNSLECRQSTSGEGLVCQEPKSKDCTPGAIQKCYTGPAGTLSKGECKAGTQTCTDEGKWGECQNQVLPKEEVCEKNPDNAGHKKDEDCDGEIDEGFDSSESCLKNPIASCVEGAQRNCYPEGADKSKIGKGICKQGVQTCTKGVWGPCVGAIVPNAKEACNSKDDNCDGQVDEGCGCTPGNEQACGSSVGECKEGTQKCQKDGNWGPCTGETKSKAEICNGKDDDCDGSIDESITRDCKNDCGSGKETCQHGGWVACTAPTPKAEICNGKDDDCDGATDEGFSLKGTKCAAGVGECRSSGTYICRPDGAGVICDAQPNQSKSETCNDKDDDCDGLIDEGVCSCTDGQTRPCGSPIGECKQGKQTCVGGVWSSTCTGSIAPKSETCNGKDDDCDGQTDEDFAQLGQTCVVGTGACQATAKFTCDQSGLKVVCPASALPAKQEVCNGKDDDCDGQMDEGCPCVQGQTRSCGVNTGSCQAGQQRCRPNSTWGPCEGSTSPQTEKCNGQDDDCDGQTDEDFSNLGQTCSAGSGICQSSGRFICSRDGARTICNAQPKSAQRDVCNGKDDDCDGSIDEDYPQKGKPCSAGKGACLRQGTYQCQQNGSIACSVTVGTPLKEACNGKDDDCDGEIDEDFQNKGKACTAGLGPCQKSGTFVCNSQATGTVCNAVAGQPQTEVCNGKDDDCDGKIDNGFSNLGQTCSVGVGACKDSGRFICDPLNNKVTKCSVSPKPASIERCNGLDDDCDGATDENFTQLKQGCIVGKGVCTRTGQFQCNQAGDGVTCSVQPPQGSATEKCDGVDDNCDGRVDEGCSCTDGQTQSCYTGPAGTDGKGLCKKGNQICQNGQWGQCIGEVTPIAEICNGKDDDCNGTIDDGFNVGSNCQVGTGECQRTGRIICATNGQAVCNAIAGTPSAEKCDGKDNDCDGQVDEDFSTKNAPCSSGLGECKAFGKLVCKQDGSGLQCDAVVKNPIAEKCDGLDNDCDGQTDEDFASKGQTCTAGNSTCRRTGTFVCKTDNSGLECSVKPGPAQPEVCNGVDDDCDGSIDENFPQKGKVCVVGRGECQNTGVFQCDPQNTSAVKCSVQPKQATNELCDGKDNDCDGLTDEDFSQKGLACTNGTGECQRSGVQVCKSDGSGLECNATPGTPATEICDGKDNDCDGLTDENLTRSCGQNGPAPCKAGIQVCQNGSFGACQGEVKPQAEKCNGVDDDCDGSVDENFSNKGQACTAGVGACLRTGVFVCNSQQTATVCNATAGTAGTEVCNSIDDDCDGSIDEGGVCNSCTADVPCYTGNPQTINRGECRAGVRKCVNGQLDSQCVGEITPQTEVCDFKDNNCDGTVDNVGGGVTCPTACTVDVPCYTGPGGTQNVGLCKAGVRKCVNGVLQQACTGQVTPVAESCNQKDDDCDGSTDEGGVCNCTNGQTKPCYSGASGTQGVGPCKAGTQTCTNNTFGACVGEVTPTTETCNSIDDDCDGQVDNVSGGCSSPGNAFTLNYKSTDTVGHVANGVSYIGGGFRGTQSFGTISLSAPLNADNAFVAKVDSSGKVLWARKFGGSGYTRVTATASNATNVFAAGFFQGTGSFGGTTLTSNGSNDIFVLKLDTTNGNVVWAKSFGSANVDNGWAVAVDASGNVFFAGEYRASFALRSGTNPIVLKAPSGYDLFIAKLDTNGNPLWAARGGGGSDERIRALSTDAAGNVYAAGKFLGSRVRFYGTNDASFQDVSSLNNSQDAFAAKWTGAGVIQWVRPLGDSGTDVARGILSSGADVYVSGAEGGVPMWAKLTASQGGVTFKKSATANGLANGLALSGSSLWLATGTGTSSLLIEVDTSTGSQKSTKAVTGASQEARAVGVNGGVVIAINSPYLNFNRSTNADSSVQGIK